MSNFVVGIGGSGAKLMQALIHLGAAGMMPAHRTEVTGLLVDPDESNGNVLDCLSLEKAYQDCRRQLKVGKTDLFAADISLTGPWTPLVDPKVDTLKKIFHYNQLAATDSEEAQLMDLFFERQELDLSVIKGFRGRPAIGAAVFANSVDFGKPGVWKEFRSSIKTSSTASAPHVLFAGSVFGGSGAAGLPTLSRLLSNHLKGDVTNARFGLILFLPFFQFQQVEGEAVQADPASFPMATAEALKYYDDQNFLQICNSIYAVGEEFPAEMSVPAVGAKEQRNEAHFIELVAGMGAIRFFDDKLQSADSLAVAAREKDSTLTWNDLPTDGQMKKANILQLQARLQQLAVFAVAYHYIFYPEIQDALQSPGAATKGYWRDLIVRKGVNPQEAQVPLAAADAYAVLFLEWLLQLSTPRRGGFYPGLVNPNVFAKSQGMDWTLKLLRDFQPDTIKNLLKNRPKSRIDYRTIDNRASRANVKDDDAQGPGLLVRALYDACAVD